MDHTTNSDCEIKCIQIVNPLINLSAKDKFDFLKTELHILEFTKLHKSLFF